MRRIERSAINSENYNNKFPNYKKFFNLININLAKNET